MFSRADSQGPCIMQCAGMKWSVDDCLTIETILWNGIHSDGTKILSNGFYATFECSLVQVYRLSVYITIYEMHSIFEFQIDRFEEKDMYREVFFVRCVPAIQRNNSRKIRYTNSIWPSGLVWFFHCFFILSGAQKRLFILFTQNAHKNVFEANKKKKHDF